MRILKSHPQLKRVNSYVINSPQPSNLSYLWNSSCLWYFGCLLAFSWIIQVTSVILAMHYNPSVLEAFNSVEHIMRDDNNGWLIRQLYSDTASTLFFLVYLQLGSLNYAYRAKRILEWAINTVIFILMMATAFLGFFLYVKGSLDILFLLVCFFLTAYCLFITFMIITFFLYKIYILLDWKLIISIIKIIPSKSANYFWLRIILFLFGYSIYCINKDLALLMCSYLNLYIPILILLFFTYLTYSKYDGDIYKSIGMMLSLIISWIIVISIIRISIYYLISSIDQISFFKFTIAFNTYYSLNMDCFIDETTCLNSCKNLDFSSCIKIIASFESSYYLNMDPDPYMGHETASLGSYGDSPAPSGGGGPNSPGTIIVNPDDDDGGTYYDMLSPSQNRENLIYLPVDNASSPSPEIFPRSPSQVQAATPRQPFIQQQLPPVQPRQNIGVLQQLAAAQPIQVGQNLGVLQQLHQPAVIGAQQIPAINIQIVENSRVLRVFDPLYCITDGAEAEGSRLKRFLTSASGTVSTLNDYDHLSQYHCTKRSYFGSLAKVHWCKDVISAPVDVTNLHPHLQQTMGISMPISRANQDMLNAGSIRLQVEGNLPIIYKPAHGILQRVWLPISQPTRVNLIFDADVSLPFELKYPEPVAGHTC